MEDSMDRDMDLLRPQSYLFSVEEDAESDDEEEEDVELLSISEKPSAPGSGNKVPHKKVKLAADKDDDDDDDNDDDEDNDDDKTEEKAPVKEGQESFKKQEKTKTPEGSSSIEDIKAKIQASIEKDGSFPRVEAKFINYVKNCFRMTDQEALQDL
ncbi:nucleophosmin-like [Orycteropus afer afer]|uniref:Nucleophosmin-like n=1 Tax=Orycteropus afer afer TaxID=1230840 RepID=A0AC54ZB87_ORYAF|nr:nucleophosmin-like [Orycteropus afer afer]